ncbi:hypothetical protein DKZ22_09535 [Limosilactobacillus reuteri]|uniref:Uncharacterized protein n=1 Tax=Limosilactobacillus reuteri TaxID=1598 RepID=A0A855XE44_LIMRT|nr:hypothetical protein [Limosilactobacillus reuteri]PWT34075.1 hypothetical protein DKZ21_00310 [Limosilactobacillus reuteri]PWT40093.1 hypothetical protein DKZ22_09535 [Limosilactobacillus reuteri]PWT45507.1 hypothetical protein DKZ25_00310 [Limosilactobacillus reuteri]PWT68374.1 hypothetical protein DKZ26_09415 [Limosilactobacillus reuteri]
MIDVTTVNLPTHFEEIESSNDSRFQKVKIYIAHTGENLNKSIFSREVLENMIPSLSHIPILGLISEKDNGDKDFRGHEKNISLEDGKFKIKFNTHAYGFVPEDNNAHFEITGGKEWLVTDGYLWTRFIDAIELFNDASGSKGQSMEVGDVEGYTDNRGRLVFTNAVFTGLCILGDDVPPAMTGSTVSTVFSKQDFKSTFEEMLAEFSAEKGEKALATKKKQNDEPAVATTVTEPESSASTEPAKSATPASSANTSSASKTAAEPAKAEDKTKASPASADSSTSGKASTNEPSAEPTTEEHEDVDDESAQMSSDKNDKDTNILNKNESAFKKGEEDDEPDSDDAEDDKEDKKFACGSSKKKKKAQFELSLSDREHSLGDAVYQKYVDGTVVQDIWPVEIFEDYGIFRFVNWSDDNRQLFRIAYSVNADDSIKLGDKTEIFSMYVTQEEKNKIENNRAKLADLETKIAELTEYKNNIEMSQKEKALDEVRALLTAEQMKNIRGKFTEMSVEDVKREIAYAMYSANKQEFMHSKRGGVRTTNFNTKQESDFGYGTADDLFRKRY